MSALRDAIVLHLQADSSVTDLATGGIFPGLPPEDEQQYPFVSVDQFRKTDVEWTFQGIAYRDGLFIVKAIDKNTSSAAVDDIAAAIETSLNLAALTITGRASMGIMLVAELEYSDFEDSQHYQYAGGIYSLLAE